MNEQGAHPDPCLLNYDLVNHDLLNYDLTNPPPDYGIAAEIDS